MNSNCHLDPSVDFIDIKKEINENDNAELTKEVLDEEIFNTVNELALNKSPGPNGFTIEFFLSYWHIVGKATCRAVKAFFHSSKLLKEINHTYIALIRKVDSPNNSNDFRPICLCNIIYKIIAKILANRMKKVTPKLIHPF